MLLHPHVDLVLLHVKHAQLKISVHHVKIIKLPQSEVNVYLVFILVKPVVLIYQHAIPV